MAEINIESGDGFVPPPGRVSPNYLPSVDDQRKWLRRLREAADLGDPTAQVGLILLARLQRDERGRKDTVSKLLDAIAP